MFLSGDPNKIQKKKNVNKKKGTTEIEIVETFCFDKKKVRFSSSQLVSISKLHPYLHPTNHTGIMKYDTKAPKLHVLFFFREKPSKLPYMCVFLDDPKNGVPWNIFHPIFTQLKLHDTQPLAFAMLFSVKFWATSTRCSAPYTILDPLDGNHGWSTYPPP